MTIKELIAILLKLDENLIVMKTYTTYDPFNNDEYEYDYEIYSVYSDNQKVYLS